MICIVGISIIGEVAEISFKTNGLVKNVSVGMGILSECADKNNLDIVDNLWTVANILISDSIETTNPIKLTDNLVQYGKC